MGDDTDDTDVPKLAAALEYMPLAIAQAAAYISQRAPRFSVGQYLADFRKSDRRKTSLLDWEGGQLRRDWEAQNSIILTWQISFEHIRQTWPSAAELLSLMSFFDRQSIPDSLIRNRAAGEQGRTDWEKAHKGMHRERKDGAEETEGGDDEDEEDSEDGASKCSEDDRFEEDVRILRDFSFISSETDWTFEMHALVQLATRKWLEAHGELEKWKQHSIKTLSSEFPTEEHKDWASCRALLPHMKLAVTKRPKGDGSLRAWALPLYNAAWYVWSQGNITEAVDLSEKAMKVRGELLGQEHEETLDSISMAGLAYKLGGRWKEAEKLEVQVMEIRKTVLGEEHPSTLTSIGNLASIYWSQGR